MAMPTPLREPLSERAGGDLHPGRVTPLRDGRGYGSPTAGSA